MVQGRLFRASAVAFAMVAVTFFAVFGSGASADEEEIKTRDQGQDEAVTLPENQAPAIPEKQGQRYPNLGSHLDRLVIQVEAGEASVQDAAEGAAMPGGGTVAVTIHLSGNVDEVVRFLEDNGGDPRNVGEDYIESYVPVTLLGRVSQQAGVIRVREIVVAEPDQSPSRVAGHGPPVHGSAAWNKVGYAGQGVKVGIIDGDFRGLSSLMGTDLPTTVVARCYTDVGVFSKNLADCKAVSDETVYLPFPECGEAVQRRSVRDAGHGTIVSEAIIDIAPEVSLYIANPQSRADMQDVVEWMASEGVAVINQSQNWLLDGPGDGTSPRSNSPLRTVDLAVARDITWVNSTGNTARNTWFGGYEDPDGDRIISFASGLNDEFLDIPVGECRRYTIQLRWEDTWNGASTDLDLYLYDKRSGELIPAISSRDEQSGESGHEPFEWLQFWSKTDSDDLSLIVYHHGGDAPDWIQLMVWGPASIEHYTKSGSIGNPSESANPGLLAVGAAHWDDVRAIEPYSSRGPTPDGRVKPDVVGADCGATALEPLNEYNQGFCGTSQAAPHVAGMAALVRQRFPGYTPAQVAGYLKDTAQQRQSPDPNNTWGHGFAKLPAPDGSVSTVPTPSNAFTRNLAAEFDTLTGAFNWTPQGIWSDGTTMWVADWLDAKLYAYHAVTKARVPGRDFDTLAAAGNTWPGGIWSDGTTMWVADWLDQEIYAYDIASKARVPGKEFNTLEAAGNAWPQGIWSDGTTMYVADFFDEKIYAYDMETRVRVPGKDYDTLRAARNRSPRGIWSDGTTMWVADSDKEKVYAYDVATRARVSGREFNTLEAAGNWGPRGIWSDGTTMWVADFTGTEETIYAYSMLKESAADKGELIAFYNATGGTGWTNNANWLTSSPMGHWHGVTIDDDGRVTRLDLHNNQLSGNIPSELGNLSNLRELVLSENQLTGSVPTWLGNLANLTVLSLGGNQLTGEIPTELGSLSNLTVLSLSDNQLTGEIPPELGDLANLEELYLSENQLTGCIPVGIAGVANNDLDQIGLPFCGGSQGAPSINSITTGANFLTVTWTAPGVSGGSAIIAYDLRYIQSDATNKSDARWAVVDNAWTTGSGPLSYQLSGLTTITQYDLQIRAVTATGDGPWSSTATGTPTPPTGASATRSFSAAWVAPGGTLTVTITADNYGSLGRIVEDVPAGFTTEDGSQTVIIRLLAAGPQTSTYTVTASDVEGSYTFSGTLRDDERNNHAVGGDTTVTVSSGDPLVARYDANNNGTIEKNEVITAINDYLFGVGDAAISKADVIEVINLYLFG